MNLKSFLKNINWSDPGTWVGLFIGGLAVSFTGVILVGLFSFIAGSVWNSLALTQCLRKGHSMIYCDRALNGKNINLDEKDLDQ